MSFLMFRVLFAALAVGLLAIVLMIVRQNVAKRQPKAPQVLDETTPKAPRLRKPLAKQAAEPEPEMALPEPPQRRRQLQSFADAERSAAEAEVVVLPFSVVEPEAEAVADHEVAPAAELDGEVLQVGPDSEGEQSIVASDYGEPDFNDEVLGRLEDAFEELQSGELTLEAYRARVMAEAAAVEERIAALQDGGDGAELEAALAARDSVHWCLDWAREQACAEG